MFVLHYYFIDKRTLCFVFEGNVNDKRPLHLSFIVTLVISARSVLYLIVTVVMNAHSFYTTLLRLMICPRSVLCFIVTLVGSEHYNCTLQLRQ